MSKSFKSKPPYKPQFNSNFSIRYPDITVKHDDKTADAFFSHVISGDVNGLNILITQNSIPINIKREDDLQNALHIAVQSSQSKLIKINMIKYLLMNYIPLDEIDKNGNTALLIACKNADSTIVNILLEYGADPTIGNSFNVKPIHYISGGILHKCENIINDSIIEKPNNKTHDKTVVNNMVKEITKYYNEDVLKDYKDLAYPELNFGSKVYGKSRLLAFFNHCKHLIDNVIKDERIKDKIDKLNGETIIKYTSQIKDITVNQSERNRLIQIRKEYVEDYISIIESVDRQMLKEINLVPTMDSDGDGLFVAKNDGTVIQDSTNNYYWKVHGEPTLNQVLQNKYEFIDQKINVIASQLKSSKYLDVIEPIYQKTIESGNVIKKMEIVANLIRLKEIAAGLGDLGYIQVNRTSIINSFSRLNTTNYNIAGATQLNQNDQANMQSYGIMLNNGASQLNLLSNNDYPTDRKYPGNLLNELNIINDFKPFTNKITINFSAPMDLTFVGGNVGVEIFPRIGKGAKGIVQGSNLVNVISLELEYNSLSRVKVTGTVINANDNNRRVTRSTGEFLSRLVIRYIGGNLVNVRLSLDENNQNLPQQHLYQPVYAMFKNIKDNYMTELNAIITAIENLKIFENQDLSTFDAFYQGIKNYIKLVNRHQIRYKIFLEKYYENIISNRLDKINVFTNALLSKRGVDETLVQDMILSLNKLKFDGQYITRIEDELKKSEGFVKSLLENLKDINLVNTINHFYNSQTQGFDITRYFNNDDLDKINFDYEIDDNYLENGFIKIIDLPNLPNLQNNTRDVNADLNFGQEIKKGLNFVNIKGNEQEDFEKPKFEIVGSSITSNYFKLIRYRMIEEVIMYVFSKKNSDLFNLIDKYVKDNIGKKLPDHYKHPMILSIIGDTIDHLLVNNIKKNIYDTANQSFMDFVGSNIKGINLGTEIKNGKGQYTDLNIRNIEFDNAFDLDLGNIESVISKAIEEKVTTLTSNQREILNIGDKLIMDPEYKNLDHIPINPNAKAQQIFYSTGFLENSGKNMCIKYNDKNLEELINLGVDLDEADMYGNTALFYAIKTNNYLAIERLLKNGNSNARVLFKNKQSITPLHYSVHKLKQICEYFPKDNLIISINEMYNIGLKEEILKIDSSHNLMKHYDKLVQLYLFMYNSNAFSSIYGKNYNLTKKYLDLISNNLEDTYQKENGGKFELLLENPLSNYINKTNIKYINNQSGSVLLNNKNLIENEINKQKKERKRLMEQNSKLREYRDLLNDDIITPKNYGKNVIEQMNKLKGKINNLSADIDKNKNLVKDIESNLAKINFTIRDSDISKQLNDLIRQNIMVSQIFDDDKKSRNDSSPYLKLIDKMLKSKTHGMSSYNVHSHLNKSIKSTISSLLEYLDSSYYSEEEFKSHYKKFSDLKELVLNLMSLRIFKKYSMAPVLEKNKILEEDYKIMCFTIDQVVGYSYYKVLKRVVFKYLTELIPLAGEDKAKYVEFIGGKVKEILEKSGGESLSVKEILLPKYEELDDKDKFKYEPSYMTKRMVLTNANIRTEEQFLEDTTSVFNLVNSLILNNNVIPIDDKLNFSKYLEDIIGTYFKSYYATCINTLSTLNLNNENMIQNQYVLLKIVDKMLEKLVNPDDNTYQIQNFPN